MAPSLRTRLRRLHHWWDSFGTRAILVALGVAAAVLFVTMHLYFARLRNFQFMPGASPVRDARRDAPPALPLDSASAGARPAPPRPAQP